MRASSDAPLDEPVVDSATLARLYAEPGATGANLARRFGVAPATAARWLADAALLPLDPIVDHAKLAEIENVLLGFPKIGDVAVFGIPKHDWGEEIKAVVEPAHGVEPSPELADEILAYCAEKLARFKTPKSIDFTDAMPRDPNGKLYKRKLRDPYWEGREKI